jgi:hypothetical protein
VIRWCLLLSTGPNSKVEIDRWALSHRWQRALLSYQKLNKKKIDLRELAAVLRAIGLDDRKLGRQLLQSNRYAASPFLRSDNLLWPYFAERLDLLEEALGLKQDDEESSYSFWEMDKRQNAFGILKLFPRLPAKFIPMLWDIENSEQGREGGRSPGQPPTRRASGSRAMAEQIGLQRSNPGVATGAVEGKE